jgi:hypothetical protein
MKSKVFVFLACFFLTSFPASAEVTPRPIFATSIYNGAGALYIPTSTPFGNRACYFDGTSTVAASITTKDELSFVHGVTAPIQDQINAISHGGISRSTATISVDTTILTLTGDYIVNVDTTVGPISVTLPNAIASDGFFIYIKKIGSHAVTVVSALGQKIDGSTSISLTDVNEARHLGAVSGNWSNY